MAVFNDIVIRCELFPDEVAAGTKFTNIRTGRAPAMYKGAQMEIQVAIFKKRGTTADEDDAELYDISQFTGLPKMRIRTATAGGTILLDETVATSVEKDPSLDLTSWADGSKQHFRFVFAETVTAIAVGVQFLVIYGPDGDVFGISTIEVIDPGTGIGTSPTPPVENYYTKTEVNGKLADLLPKQFADDQPLVMYALNQATGQRARITLQPLFDEGGARMVPIVELL